MSTAHSIRSRGTPLPTSTRARLRRLVERVGDAYQAAEVLGVGAPTVARALGGLGLRRGSATAIEARLNQIEAEQAA